MKTIPETARPYFQSPVFDQDSAPANLRKRHQTKPGAWAKINVIEGRLLFTEIDGESRWIDRDNPGIAAPEEPHYITLDEPVSFFLEFYQEA